METFTERHYLVTGVDKARPGTETTVHARIADTGEVEVIELSE